MPGGGCSAAGRDLFEALFALGLDRSRFSIHEMLTDILEVVAVREGLRPAHLSGHGERAEWQIDGFERIAAAAGLRTRRSPPVPPAAEAAALVAAEFPAFASAMRERDAARQHDMPEVLWIWREASLEGTIDRLLAGDRRAFGELLGYPDCCVAHELRRDVESVRALLRLYEAQHGIRGEADVLAAIGAGVTVHGAPAASEALESVWRTRLVYPWGGYTACPDCLRNVLSAPSAVIDTGLRQLALALDRGFARAVWQAARGEAGLASRGDFRALEARPGVACPCGSGADFERCCAEIDSRMPEFR